MILILLGQGRAIKFYKKIILLGQGRAIYLFLNDIARPRPSDIIFENKIDIARPRPSGIIKKTKIILIGQGRVISFSKNKNYIARPRPSDIIFKNKNDIARPSNIKNNCNSKFSLKKGYHLATINVTNN